MSNYGVYVNKNPSTTFVVQNIAPKGKRIKLFQYPIKNGEIRDLLEIPGLTEADIRGSLLKGELLVKIKNGEVKVIDSSIDLLQFDDDQKAFLEDAGVNKGLEVTGGGGLPAAEHKVLRQLIHLAETGPFDGFGSVIYRETLPASSPFPTSIIWWESSAKLKKIVEKEISYNTSNFPISIVWIAYDVDGATPVATSTDNIVYFGAFEISRTRTFS
jgi:hypothetical protein